MIRSFFAFQGVYIVDHLVHNFLPMCELPLNLGEITNSL